MPIVGYYLVRSIATFSSSSSSYAGPAFGNFARIDITVDGVSQSLGSALTQIEPGGLYTSVVSDVVFVPAGGTISASAFADDNSFGGSIYLWSAGGGDTSSTFISATYCAP